MEGLIEAIYVTPQGGAPMQKVEESEAVAARGLRGDRYSTHAGYWSPLDECQVTLIEGETLDQIREEAGLEVGHGEHRRNIVTRGIRLHALAGKHFTIGEAGFEYDRPRPPCGYIQAITQVGMTRALLGERGGICARVVKSGVIRTGDKILVGEPAVVKT